jgi:hypothetical protein
MPTPAANATKPAVIAVLVDAPAAASWLIGFWMDE